MMKGSSSTDELRALYARKKELLKKFDLAKDSAESTRVWEALSAAEHQKIARRYFHQCGEEIDRKMTELEKCEGKIEERRIHA